jgi:prevent-host-death family protein
MIAIGHEWQLQTAKNKFSEVVNLALAGEAQLVKRHGKPAVYIVSSEQFDHLNSNQGNLKELLLNSPHKDINLKLERSRDTGRDIEL